MDHKANIRRLLKDGLIVPVVGAGVSSATADIPGWKGLVDQGIQYAEALGYDSTLINEAKSLSSVNELTKAAGIVKRLLNAPKHPYTNWLNEMFGRPVVKNTALIESIQNLCQPLIATTNYDQLLTNVGNMQTDLAFDWKQHSEIQSCLNKRQQFVLHLHGVYTRPDTPIFGDDDYDRIRHATGYKTILTNLWMNKHFLFIGCSRDGVMDEDFLTVLRLMQEWFPGDQKEHYILSKEKMIGTPQHHELIKLCNVHLVPFGNDNDDLPKFINGLNPNAEQLVTKFNQRKALMHDGLVAILDAQPNVGLAENVKMFIQSNLGIQYHWLDNDRLEVFTAALQDYNSRQVNKQKQLIHNQVMIRTIISEKQLQEKIDLWNHGPQDTSKLNNTAYINTAILAFDMLKTFPREMLEDIHSRNPYIIHNYYLSGELDMDYQRAVSWKKRSRNLSDFDGDRYFFENLKRIIQSLLEVLTLNSEEIYGKKTEAQITKKLQVENLLIVHPTRLTLRNISYPYEIHAELPWDQNLKFINAFLVSFESNKIVVGYNSNHCFKWNPQKELIADNFFTAERNDHIVNLTIISKGDNLVLEILTQKARIIAVNFSAAKPIKLSNSRHINYIRLNQINKHFCTIPIYTGQKGNCIFEMDEFSEYHGKQSLEALWKFIRQIPEINAEHQAYLLEEGITDEVEDIFYPYIQNVTLQPGNWFNKEIIIVRVTFYYKGQSTSTALLFVDPALGFSNPILTVLFHGKNCFSFDIISKHNQVNLLIGYLDTSEVGNLVQYFENISAHELILSRDQPGIIPQDRLNHFPIRDMLSTVIVTPERAFVVENGRILHDISLPELNNIKIEFEDPIVAIHYYHENNPPE
ncbi:MAG: SIR2 family protein [Chitinophaga sp.]|uniref:SIR2 family protein n=1 Tax=Chitinophaga sp. TaxID=1869181 RepID=UPI001B20D819|nr:SIR2 family protein [Chitinophaga sp.]MBO9730852.1 SIR2 family protein [Chitinophaga sp.]